MTYSVQGKPVNSASARVFTRFRRPNWLYLDITDSRGERTVYCDGKDVTLYDKRANTYRRLGPAPGTLDELMPLLQSQAGITAQLDPLYFLGHDSLPAVLLDLQVSGSDVVESHRVTRVTGITPAQDTGLKTKTGVAVVVPASRWVWWIDRQTHLLWRIDTTAVARVRRIDSGPEKSAQRLVADTDLRHDILTVQTNIPLGDAEFTFHPPVGAVAEK